MVEVDIASVMARLGESPKRAVAVPTETLAGIAWLDRAPSDYTEYLRRFGGKTVTLFCWTLPSAEETPELEESFRAGGPPAHLVPFAEQDGTWFMAFDLSHKGRIVEWDHEEAAAAPFDGTFAAWLAVQLDRESTADQEEEQAAQDQRRWAREHVPFCDTPLGKKVALRLGTPAGTKLRDVLLDLHLQYTFHSRVVENQGSCYLGLLHFTDNAVGCWRCGRMNGGAARMCTGCDEPLLQRTFGEATKLTRNTTAWEPCFGMWAATYVNVDSPQPTLVSSRLHPQGIPTWARLTTFGGTRDPRVAAVDEWEPPQGDTM